MVWSLPYCARGYAISPRREIKFNALYPLFFRSPPLCPFTIITFLARAALRYYFLERVAMVLLSIVTDLPCFLFPRPAVDTCSSNWRLRFVLSFRSWVIASFTSDGSGARKTSGRKREKKKTQGECGARADKHARKIFSIVPGVSGFDTSLFCPTPRIPNLPLGFNNRRNVPWSSRVVVSSLVATTQRRLTRCARRARADALSLLID